MNNVNKLDLEKACPDGKNSISKCEFLCFLQGYNNARIERMLYDSVQYKNHGWMKQDDSSSLTDGNFCITAAEYDYVDKTSHNMQILLCYRLINDNGYTHFADFFKDHKKQAVMVKTDVDQFMQVGIKICGFDEITMENAEGKMRKYALDDIEEIGELEMEEMMKTAKPPAKKKSRVWMWFRDLMEAIGSIIDDAVS